MKILSFDIGIKNLAFIIGDYDEETDKFDIQEWDIINLLGDEIDAQCKCSHISKRKPYKQCGNIALHGLSNGDEYYCKAHLKNYTHIKPVVEKYTSEEKTPCCNEECTKVAKYIIDGTDLYCPTHKKETETFFKKNYSLTKINTIKCKTFSVEKIADKIVEIFDSRYAHFLEAEVVLLELQPAMKAPKMKTISNYISMYFRIRGIHDIEENKMRSIKYYRATNKLKFNENNTRADTKTYANRKKTAIRNVIEYLDVIEDYENKEKFMKHKKKDDLSDAILQVLSFFQK